MADKRIVEAFANWRATTSRKATTLSYAEEYPLFEAGFKIGERRAVDRIRRYVEDEARD